MVDIRCEVNGQDISADLEKYFTEINITDHDGTKSDQLNIVLTNAIKRPKYDDKIKLWINAVLYGEYLVQSTNTNHLSELTIIATGTNFSNNLKVKKNKSYNETTLGSIIQEKATEHGLNFKVDFQDLEVSHLIQEDESDLHFMNRLSKDYDAIFSVKNNTLLFLERSENLPSLTIDLSKCSRWNIAHSNRKIYNACTINFKSTKENKTLSVTTGQDEPILVKKGVFKTKEEALVYAEAELQKSTRGTKEGNLQKKGEYISAGSTITLINSKQDDGKYTVESVYTSINRNGYIVEVDFKN